jgi:two-component system chemotaxis sensor kinase CheA
MDLERDLIQAFLEESAELVESFEQGLLELERASGDPEVLHRIFRAAHTIKGNSGMLGLTDVAHFTHVLEDVLDRLRKGRLHLSPDGMRLLLRSLDMLKAKLAALGQGTSPPEAAVLVEALRAYANGTGEGATPETPATEREGGGAPPAADLGEGDRPRLGEILVAEKLAPPEAIGAALKKQKRIGEILVEDKVVAPEHVAHALKKQALATPRAEAASIRVQTEKVDKLVNLVGEMVITQSMLGQILSRFSPEQLPRLTETVAAMERHTRELQERVMSVRMQPIKTIFGRFHRLVRDLAEGLGKQVRLEVSGEETELDKTVIDRIGDPLTHLVRNCVDHGVEAPADRLAAGKASQGRIRLHAFHQGGNIFIEVEDDGRGLDRERIWRKAVEQGLVREDETLGDDQVFPLIFRPGFSTAERVSDISGRGVGMDVVQRSVQALGGHVAIHSIPGQGTRFTIALPLTLAILDGLSVQVGDEIYIIPLINIVESIRPHPGQVQTIAGTGEVVNVRGRVLSILRLHALFGARPRILDPCRGLLVILESGREQVALLVDDLVGQHQVVIKSLEANYQHVDGVAGATIMGDGRVALILDVPGLISLARSAPALAAV